LDFTRTFGPIPKMDWAGGKELGDVLEGLPTLDDVVKEAKSVALVGLMQRAVAGDEEAQTQYRERAVGDFQKPSFDVIQKLTGDTLRRAIAGDLEGTVNIHMKVYTVFTQIRRVHSQQPSPGFEPSYEPSSLRGAIWAQVAGSLITGSIPRRCKFCGLIFEAPSALSLLEYCPRKTTGRNCQSRAKDRRKNERIRLGKQQAEKG
jgi:hypothetical protein